MNSKKMSLKKQCLHILIAGSDCGSQKFISEYLTKKYPELALLTTSVNDVIEFVRCCVEGEHDIIFLDVLAPEMDGLRVSSVVKGRKPHLYIVAVVAAVGDLPKKYQQFGIEDLVTKPIREEQLALIIDEALKRKKQKVEA